MSYLHLFLISRICHQILYVCSSSNSVQIMLKNEDGMLIMYFVCMVLVAHQSIEA